MAAMFVSQVTIATRFGAGGDIRTLVTAALGAVFLALFVAMNTVSAAVLQGRALWGKELTLACFYSIIIKLVTIGTVKVTAI